LGAQVHLIGILGDANGLGAQLLALESIGLVDASGAFEPGNPSLMNIGDGEISMQRLFVDKRLLRLVASLKLHFQLGADRHAKAQVESGIAETSSSVVGRKR